MLPGRPFAANGEGTGRGRRVAEAVAPTRDQASLRSWTGTGCVPADPDIGVSSPRAPGESMARCAAGPRHRRALPPDGLSDSHLFAGRGVREPDRQVDARR